VIREELEPVLRLEQLDKRFGGVHAVVDISLSVGIERIVGVIGPNGSGKSTLCNLISCVAQPTSGKVFLKGSEITGMRPDKVFRLGLSRTFQNTRLFPRLTVAENMLIAARGRRLESLESTEQLERMDLAHLHDVPAGGLSYGDQKLLELAMSLIGKPAIALLDEPLAGVHESVVERIRNVVEAESKNTVFLIVEHNVSFMMQICERIIVMNQGEVLADGSPSEIRSDQTVIKAYLGSQSQAEASGSDTREK